MRGAAAALLLLASMSAVAADFDAGVEAYERGDYAAALREFRPFAEQGNAAAQFNLGLMYHNGEGVAEDDREAAFWFRKAAKQGDAEAQLNLGVMYVMGEGVPEDLIRACTWFNLAVATGDESTDAKKNRSIIRDLMTPTQITEAQALSRTLAARIGSGQSGAAPSPIPDDPAQPSSPSRDLVLRA